MLDDESVKCWGLNSLGSLGVGDTVSRGMSAGDMGDNLPEVPLTFGNGLGGVSNVFAGMSHSCVSGTEGGLVCFGYNNMGQVCFSRVHAYLSDLRLVHGERLTNDSLV